MLPTTTPREVLYMETGMKDIEHHAMTKRINMHCRLQNTRNETLQLLMNSKNDKAWINKT